MYKWWTLVRACDYVWNARLEKERYGNETLVNMKLFAYAITYCMHTRDRAKWNQHSNWIYRPRCSSIAHHKHTTRCKSFWCVLLFFFFFFFSSAIWFVFRLHKIIWDWMWLWDAQDVCMNDTYVECVTNGEQLKVFCCFVQRKKENKNLK